MKTRLLRLLPVLPATALCALLAAALPAQPARPAATADPAGVEIAALLNDFLARGGQSANHDRFWAEDLIYTSSAAQVMTKAEILKDVREEEAARPPGRPAPPEDTFSAEDIVVRPFGDCAALTFRLVRHTVDQEKIYYRNSAMFVRRAGRWQVVTWQATKIPDEPAK